MTRYKYIFWITAILTILLTIFAFILSFNALTDLARQHKVSIPPLFPFVVEFGVIVFSLNALYRSLNNESAKWQWALIISSFLLAGTFNVIHAESDLVSKIMAAMPSIFVLFSFESLLNLIRFNLSNRQESMPKVKTLDTFRSDKRKKLERLIQLKSTGIQNDEIIKKLKITPQTFETYLSDLTEIGVLNGHTQVQT